MQRDLDEKVETALASSETLRKTAKATRKWLSDTFVSSPLQPLKNLLNGTWLEHPLHPVLTDIPIGAWTVAMVLDAASVFLGVRHLGKASAIAIGIGTLGAVGAAATGVMDYTDTEEPEDTTALTHGLVNLTATLLFTGSFTAASTRSMADSAIARGTCFARLRGGHCRWIPGRFAGFSPRCDGESECPPEESQEIYTPAIALADLQENELTRVEVAGEPILLLKRGEQLYMLWVPCVPTTVRRWSKDSCKTPTSNVRGTIRCILWKTEVICVVPRPRRCPYTRRVLRMDKSRSDCKKSKPVFVVLWEYNKMFYKSSAEKRKYVRT